VDPALDASGRRGILPTIGEQQLRGQDEPYDIGQHRAVNLAGDTGVPNRPHRQPMLMVLKEVGIKRTEEQLRSAYSSSRWTMKT